MAGFLTTDRPDVKNQEVQSYFVWQGQQDAVYILFCFINQVLLF